MIRIKKSIVDAVHNAVTPQDLYPALQRAIQLELSTIPVYLCGLFTLKETGNGQANAGVAEIMTSVVDEEMLHMCIAANTLIALGGTPVMNTAAVVPKYPGPFPGDTDDGLIVHLLPFSTDAVLNAYMRIEEPDVIIQPSGQKKIFLPLRRHRRPASSSRLATSIKRLLTSFHCFLLTQSTPTPLRQIK